MSFLFAPLLLLLLLLRHHGLSAARDLLLPEPRSRHRVRGQLPAAVLQRDLRLQRERQLHLLRPPDLTQAEGIQAAGTVSSPQTGLFPPDTLHHQRV